MRSNSPVAQSIGGWLAFARQALANEPDSALEAQLLLAHILVQPRAWLLAHPEMIIDEVTKKKLDALLGERAAGMPLPYLLGHWEFYGLDLIVTPSVLIPRPETEVLVEQAIDWLTTHPNSRTVDVGTGSGCIAVALAKNSPGARVLAVDHSQSALRVAQENARRHGVSDRISFWQGSLLDALFAPVDLICANLPYIPQPDLAALPVAQHEPITALDGGPDGLRWIEALLVGSQHWLAPGGLMLLEMQFDQGEQIKSMTKNYLPHASASVISDLSGLPRLVRIQKMG